MDIPRHWRLREQRYALIGEVCAHCNAKLFPPRDVCPACGAPAKTPYTVALIKLNEGPLVTAQLTDVDRKTIAIGMPVEMTTRILQSNGERGLIVYGYKFRPINLN